MGTYIAHTKRKIKPVKTQAALDAEAIAARQRELAARREQQRIEEERARAEKAARALLRSVEKRMTPAEPDTSGRRRTAVRAAGIMLVSATGGMRTQSVALHRLPGASGCELWRADVRFEEEKGVTHFINDPGSPADLDALHAMRALAPRIAEHLFMGPPFDDDIDCNNMRTAQRLADSYMHKSHYTASMDEVERLRLRQSIFDDLQNLAALRLRHLGGPLEQIVGTLMRKTKMSRSDCNGALDAIYRGFEEFCRAEPHMPRIAPPPAPRREAPADACATEERRLAATGTHG